jgi:hypothetical protein
MVKIEDQSDIIDKLQSTVSAYSNLHAWSHCANQAHQIFDANIVMQKTGWTTHFLFWTQTWGVICCQVGAYRRLYEEEVTAHRDSQLMTMGPIACLKQQVDGSKVCFLCVFLSLCWKLLKKRFECHLRAKILAGWSWQVGGRRNRLCGIFGGRIE